EQHQTGSQPVDTVDRYQVGIAGAPEQPRQQGLLDILTRRHHRQEMRLVGNQQMLVLPEHLLDERNWRLVGHLAEIAHLEPDAIGMRGIDGRTSRVQHTPACHTLQPGSTVDGRKVIAQTIEHRVPVALCQMKGAGAHDGAGHRRRSSIGLEGRIRPHSRYSVKADGLSQGRAVAMVATRIRRDPCPSPAPCSPALPYSRYWPPARSTPANRKVRPLPHVCRARYRSRMANWSSCPVRSSAASCCSMARPALSSARPGSSPVMARAICSPTWPGNWVAVRARAAMAASRSARSI